MTIDSRSRHVAAMLVLGTWVGVANAQMGGGDYGGMMGSGGMMGAYPDAPARDQGPEATIQVNARDARALLDYIRQQRLACMQCHTVDEGGFGPSFAQIGQYYAQRPEQASTLQQSIVQGIGRMPGGLASAGQASVLGGLILDLAKSGN